MSNKSDSNSFSEILDRAVSRRAFLQTSAAFGTAAFVLGTGSLLKSAQAAGGKISPGFQPVAANSSDTITLPPGYTWNPVASWGDPLFSNGKPFDHMTRGTAESQKLAVGDNTDGMKFYPLSDDEGVLIANNEYVNKDLFSPNGIDNLDEVIKGKAGHGISVFNVKRSNGKWSIVVDGKYNRRITADTPMALTGPAAGDPLLKTAADPEGKQSLGTWNNCGNGFTPWGTYLTCEENFNGYFGSTDGAYQPTPEQSRYGIDVKDRGYNWYKFDERFDLSKNPNECNRAGYIVEIDPMDPSSTPKKRTALGRFKHENAELVVAKNGKVVVYLGDDERGEYLYRFISENTYKEGDDAANLDLLENGTLYVARFNESDENLSGKGEWIELSHGKNGLDTNAGFESQAAVLINTRLAASHVKGTTMDRPEWVAANPNKAEVYCALTNNKNRGVKPNAGGDETPVTGPNPRAKNLYGQIVRWLPDNEDHTADSFSWNLFVLAGNPTLHKDLYGGSENITPENMFNSPDGLAFDTDGRLWIQTDGNYKNKGDFAGMGNNQMLCADTETGEIRRFLVGPIACEVTGVTWNADNTTMFVGIQHPGEKGKPSHFPEGGEATPRSTIIAISREDGGVIGS